MKTWYVIAYDIRNEKRLRRLHYFLRKRAIALQNSVFLVKANEKYLGYLSENIQRIANINLDDIRIYPVHHPDTIWAAGKQVNALENLYVGTVKKPITQKKGWLRTLLGWKS